MQNNGGQYRFLASFHRIACGEISPTLFLHMLVEPTPAALKQAFNGLDQAEDDLRSWHTAQECPKRPPPPKKLSY